MVKISRTISARVLSQSRRLNQPSNLVHILGTLGAIGCRQPSFPFVGDWADGTRCFQANDVATFSDLTGDSNSIHDPCRDGSIAHGLLVASLIPAVFARAFPGALYRSQTLTFKVFESVRSEHATI